MILLHKHCISQTVHFDWFINFFPPLRDQMCSCHILFLVPGKQLKLNTSQFGIRAFSMFHSFTVWVHLAVSLTAFECQFSWENLEFISELEHAPFVTILHSFSLLIYFSVVYETLQKKKQQKSNLNVCIWLDWANFCGCLSILFLNDMHMYSCALVIHHTKKNIDRVIT